MILGEILYLMRIFLQIEEKSMIDLRIDMEFPLSVINAPLVILKGQEERFSDLFRISLNNRGKVFGVDFILRFNLSHIAERGIKVMHISKSLTRFPLGYPRST